MLCYWSRLWCDITPLVESAKPIVDCWLSGSNKTSADAKSFLTRCQNIYWALLVSNRPKGNATSRPFSIVVRHGRIRTGFNVGPNVNLAIPLIAHWQPRHNFAGWEPKILWSVRQRINSESIAIHCLNQDQEGIHMKINSEVVALTFSFRCCIARSIRPTCSRAVAVFTYTRGTRFFIFSNSMSIMACRTTNPPRAYKI